MEDIKKRFISAMKNETKEDKHPVDFVWTAFLVMEIGMMIVGSINFDDCPIDEMVTIFIVVNGTLAASAKLLALTYYKFKLILVRHLQRLCEVSALACTIGGSIVVYRIYTPNYDKKIGLYCDKGTYLLGFSYFTICWIILGLGMIIGITACCWVFFTSEKQEPPAANGYSTNNNNHVVNINELS